MNVSALSANYGRSTTVPGFDAAAPWPKPLPKTAFEYFIRRWPVWKPDWHPLRRS
jgi:hypothetical protein